MRKLPAMFPAHLQPLVQRTLEAVTAPRSGQQQQVFAALADGLLRSSYVKLHYPPGDMSSPIPEPIVRPELLLPYLSFLVPDRRVQATQPDHDVQPGRGHGGDARGRRLMDCRRLTSPRRSRG